MNVGKGVIPKEALAVLAAGFGRHNDDWVESIARSFLETWQGAYTAYDPLEQMCIHLPLNRTEVDPDT